jgi:hypothetical protein
VGVYAVLTKYGVFGSHWRHFSRESTKIKFAGITRDATAMRPDLKNAFRGLLGQLLFNNHKCNKFH